VKKKAFHIGRIWVLVAISLLSFSVGFAWADENLQYRRPITISTTMTETDYPMRINLTYDADMKTDFGDVRFYDSDDTTKLSYCLLEKVDGSWALFQVMLPSLQDKTIYAYFGNDSYTSESNFSTCYNLYEDMEGYSEGKYTSSVGSWTVDNAGVWVISDGGDKVFYLNETNALIYYDPSSLNLSDYIATAYIKLGGAGGRYWGFVGRYEDTSNLLGKSYQMLTYDETNRYIQVRRWDDGSYTTIAQGSTTCNLDAYTKIEFRFNGSSITAKIYGCDEQTATDSTYDYGTIALLGHGSAPSYWNNITVRKIVDPEPSYSVGSRETITEPPKYSNINVTPASPQTYGISNIYFNITWTVNVSETNLSAAWIVHDFSGTNQTYFMDNITAIGESTNFSYLLNFTPAAGTYTYRFYANNTEGKINQTDLFTYTINPADSQLTLSASPSWHVAEGTQVNISCSALAGLNVTLYKDGVEVSNPYVASFTFDTYNFSCVISDTVNYTPAFVSNLLVITSGGFGCTDNQTFAFKKVVTNNTFPHTLNFTNLVNQHYVRTDLGDVWTNTSGVSLSKNTTNGYYIIVTNSSEVANYTIYFGNYFANYSYSVANLSGPVLDMTEYEEISPYYVLTFIDEITGANQLPPNSNRSISLYCADGASRFDISDPKILVATYKQLTSIRATITYSATEIYYRDYLVRAPVEQKYIYLVDANKDQVLQMLFTLTDRTGSFDSGSIFKVKKYLEGSLRTITELPFDVENKAIAFLISGDKYQIYVDNGVEERSIGEVYTDPSSLTKNIIIQGVQTLNTTYGNTSFSLTYDSGVINFVWYDPSGQSNLVEMWVYNYSSGQLLYYTSSSNKTRVNFVYTVPDTNSTYKIKWLVHHEFFGNNTLGMEQIFGGYKESPAYFPLKYLISLLGGNLFFFAMFGILPLVMLLPRRFVGIGAFLTVGIVALLSYWNVVVVSTTVLGIGLLLSILIEIHERRRWKE